MGSKEGSASAADGGNIDAAFWSSARFWTPADFEWLLLGIDPERVQEEGFDAEPFKQQRKTIRDRFDRVVPKDERSPSPKRALIIASLIGRKFPADLEAAIGKALDSSSQRDSTTSISENPRAQDVSALKRRIGSLQKIIVVMAAKGYGWDLRGDIPSDIAKDIGAEFEHLGLKIDASTLRGHLNEARNVLSPSEIETAQSWFTQP